MHVDHDKVSNNTSAQSSATSTCSSAILYNESSNLAFGLSAPEPGDLALGEHPGTPQRKGPCSLHPFKALLHSNQILAIPETM